MSDYSKAKIYILFAFKPDGTKLTFYGSTIQNLRVSLASHVRNCKQNIKNTTSKQIIELGNYEIMLIEEFPCKSIEELHARKQFYIINNECVNKVIPSRTPQEYKEQNVDKIALKNKKYNEKKKNEIIEKKNEIIENKKSYNIKNTKIYMLFGFKPDGTKLTFYGSTTQNLRLALSDHIRSYNENRRNTSSKQIIELGNYEIMLLEEFICNSIEELNSRKQFYIINNECVNKVIPLRTPEEYRIQNKEKIREKNKKYNEKKKNEIIEKQKLYIIQNKEKIKQKRKEYREKNIDKIKEKRKEYYEKNIDKINEYKADYRKKNKDKITGYNIKYFEKIKQKDKDNKKILNDKIKQKNKNKQIDE
jgi:hypothetical protein